MNPWMLKNRICISPSNIVRSHSKFDYGHSFGCSFYWWPRNLEILYLGIQDFLEILWKTSRFLENSFFQFWLSNRIVQMKPCMLWNFLPSTPCGLRDTKVSNHSKASRFCVDFCLSYSTKRRLFRIESSWEVQYRTSCQIGSLKLEFFV